MKLSQITVESFRNLATTDINTDAQFIVFSGNNAQGKTNTLEAIYYLASLRPLVAKRSLRMIKVGEDFTTVKGIISAGGVTREHQVTLHRSGIRKVSVDGESASSQVSYFKALRAIAFTPDDLSIGKGGPAERRSWIDRAVFSENPAHIDLIRSYSKLIRQKTALLRTRRVDNSVLDTLNYQISQVGSKVIRSRILQINKIEPIVRKIYTDISHNQSEIDLKYKSPSHGETLLEISESIKQQLDERREIEKERMQCVYGPHRDEVEIVLNGKILRSFGSRGQIRSLVLALKLSELMLAKEKGITLPFLLDDVGSELDESRMTSLLQILSDLQTQLFLTTTNLKYLKDLPSKSIIHYSIEGGQMTLKSPT